MAKENKERFGVRVTYRNNKMEIVDMKVYTLDSYASMLRNDLLRVITDIEDVIYAAKDNIPKDMWDDGTWSAYCRLKHRILDKAGAIERLPETIFAYDKGDGEGERKTILDKEQGNSVH